MKFEREQSEWLKILILILYLLKKKARKSINQSTQNEWLKIWILIFYVLKRL